MSQKVTKCLCTIGDKSILTRCILMIVRVKLKMLTFLLNRARNVSNYLVIVPVTVLISCR